MPRRNMNCVKWRRYLFNLNFKKTSDSYALTKKKLFPAIYRSIAHKINTLALLALVSARLVEAENGLTPLPSLRSKAHKVIREILPYI